MVIKYRISPILKQIFYYSLKVWGINLCFIIIILSSFLNGNSDTFWNFSTIIALVFLYSLPSLILFSFISSCMIVFTRINHWLKKIILLFCYFVLVLISSFIVLGLNEYDETPFYLIFSILYGLPSLLTIGLFFPDKLDEYLKNNKNTEGA